MVDDHRNDHQSQLSQPLQSRPRRQPIDHAESRVRAKHAHTHRQPTDVTDIKSRLKSVLAQEVTVPRIKDAFPETQTDNMPSAPSILSVSPLPKIEPPVTNTEPVEPTMTAEPTREDSPAKPILSENGFQIFKPNKPEDNTAEDKSLSFDTSNEDIINKNVAPVPMDGDAIEEALKLIEEQHDDDDKPQGDVDTQEVGFVPANISPGTFGAENSPEQLKNDEQLISDILSEDFADLAAPPSVSEEKPSVGPSLHVVDNPTAHDTPPEDKIQNWQIGQAIAASIRGIVKEEVDTALDQLARQAVRDAIRAHSR